MRIFQILEFNQFNTGSVHQMFQAAAGLRERGHEVTIVSCPDAILRRKAEEHGVTFAGLPFRNQFDIASMLQMRRLIRQRCPDVIHVHKGVAHAVAMAAAYGLEIGAFIVNRGVSFPLDRWNRGKYRTDRVDRIVTVCQQIKDVIVDSGKLPPQKVDVIYAGTDVNVFDPELQDSTAFRREKGIDTDRFVIAQVGVRDWKGWKELIEAVREVSSRHENIQLVLIGCRDESETGTVRDYATEQGIADRVTPVEYRTDMPNVFASCDLIVDASWAGTGITGTIREAMAMRKPVIATDAGGNRELVASAAVGWVVPMRDHGALVGAVLEVMEDRDRARRVAREAREHVKRGFSKELRITRLENLYRGILESKRRSGCE